MPAHSEMTWSSSAFCFSFSAEPRSPSGLICLPSRAENEVGYFVAEHGLRPLLRIQRLQESERCGARPTERADSLPIHLEYRRLRPSQGRRHDALTTDDRDVQRKVVPTELQHPG